MEASKKGRRPTGALAMVLEQARTEDFSREKSSEKLAVRPEPPNPIAQEFERFYPTKGFARVPAAVCRPWALADRPASEFEHQAEVGRSLKADGQLQPALVRPLSDPAHPAIRYEVIAGQVRWRAALEGGGDLDVLIKPLSDEAAFRSMVAENEFRKGLSDYARGQRLKKALDLHLYPDKTAMAGACGLTASQLSYLLGFAALEPAVIEGFKDIRVVSARLGYALNQAVKDGYRAEVIRDLGKIESGAISRHDIPHVWAKQSNAKGSPPTEVGPPRAVSVSPKQYRNDAGEVLFTVKRAATSGTSLRFPKGLSPQLSEEVLEELRAWLQQRLTS